MDKKIKLGIIGLSEGNGHPYSWSAIFNGYKKEFMKDCPFPVIPDYLSKQKFPEDCIENATITHIWTQNHVISDHVSKASNIPVISRSIEQMVNEVDAVILARDDAENHLEMSIPILEAGLPLFIDKPLAYNVKTAEQIFNKQKYDGQIFSCSALKYAREFYPDYLDLNEIGNILTFFATTPKDWEKYAVHIIDPVIGILQNRGKIIEIKSSIIQDKHNVNVQWDNIYGSFSSLNDISAPISISLFGEYGIINLIFEDTFFAFKKALEQFIKIIKKEAEPIPVQDTIEVIRIIEEGCSR